MRLLAGATLALSLLVLATKSSSSDPQGRDLSPSVEEDLQDSPRGDRIFAFFASTSTTRLVTRTLTAISTCLSTSPDAPACKRKKRRSAVLSEAVADVLPDTPLEGTLATVASADAHVDAHAHDDQRDERKLTIWTTNFTTLTITTTSYRDGTTVTATAFCLTPLLGPGCFGG